MNANDFLEYLNEFFPCDEEDSVVEKRMRKYSELLKQKEAEEGRELNYDNMLNSIIEKYPYKGFPNFSEIAKHIEFLSKKHSDFKGGRRYIVNKQGHLYEFEEVPPWWENVHSLSEFENITSLE